MAMRTQQQPILIKCYAGSRLYDPAAARYVTIEQLRRWEAEAVWFSVIDARTGADIKRVLLA
jgi:polyhydroxyalkanoate synthesis regulator protein